MPNEMELAPLANTAEANEMDERNENLYGIDDGLLAPEGNGITPNPENELTPRTGPRTPTGGNGFGPRRSPVPSLPPDFPTAQPGPRSRRPLDVNLYATKKTIAQGMMDIALLTANTNQLRYVLESGHSGPFYYFSVVLISLSIILQLVIGVILIFLGRYNVSEREHIHKAERLNNVVVLGVFLMTAINVFISAFGIHPVEAMDPALIVDATLESLKIRDSVDSGTTDSSLM